MPFIAFCLGLLALAVWLVILMLPLLAVYAVIALVAMIFGVALNAALGAGIAIMLLPAIIYLPAVLLAFALPTLFTLFDRMLRGFAGLEAFGLHDVWATVSAPGFKFLAAIGIKPRAPKRSV